MNARELHAYFAKYSEHEWSPENYQTILRALALLAAVDESGDAYTEECRAAIDALEAKFGIELVSIEHHELVQRVHERAAARIVALEASISAERANGERERGMRDQHITRLESELAQARTTAQFHKDNHRICEAELASVKAERDALKAFRDYFTDKCEGLFFQFGMEVIDLYNATHGHKDCHIEPDRAAHPKEGT